MLDWLGVSITCPECEHKETATMPIDACQWFYECKGCVSQRMVIVVFFVLTVLFHTHQFSKVLVVAVRRSENA